MGERDDVPTTFAELTAAVRVLSGFSGPWFVSGGWAMDLFAGRVTRHHGDIEIGILRNDQAAVRKLLGGYTLEKSVDGKWLKWKAGEFVDAPLHQIRLRREGIAQAEFELFLNEGNRLHLRCRRHRAISVPMSRAVRMSGLGIPYLAPEIQLLYKAKWTREKDERDFAHALPRLTGSQKQWLHASLTLCHPDHRWIAALNHSPLSH